MHGAQVMTLPASTAASCSTQTCPETHSTSTSLRMMRPRKDHADHQGTPQRQHSSPPADILAPAVLLSRRFQLSYWPVSDEGIFEPHILQARVDKEAGSARTWKRALQQHNISSLRDLHAWLHATHLCYSVSRQHEFGQPTELSPELAASY